MRARMQDVRVGHAGFDEAFVITGNDEARLRRVFADARLRVSISAQPGIHLSVRDDEGWFGASFPEGVDELRFACGGVITDLDRRHDRFDLFACVRDRLCAIGSAHARDPGVALEAGAWGSSVALPYQACARPSRS